MQPKKIRTALISVYYKDKLDEIVKLLNENDVTIYSTGGTRSFIEDLGIEVEPVEELTGYPSILDGRVKTLHPKVFGGILAIRNQDHLDQLEKYDIPELDLVIVDLYPFEETVKNTTNQEEIIEKIDIGGISLIRAAAKNFHDVVIVPSRNDYDYLLEILKKQGTTLNLDQRKHLAARAFQVSSSYDQAIHSWFLGAEERPLRYGENPHQEATFKGNLKSVFSEIYEGKELSYNNLVDVEAAVRLMREFRQSSPTFAILKHTNACGIASASTILEAWKIALAADPLSAFGGIFIANTTIDLATAQEINNLFYEVVIAPSYSPEAYQLLCSKKGRIVMTLATYDYGTQSQKSLLGGVLVQSQDSSNPEEQTLNTVTNLKPTDAQTADLIFAIKCVKHLKSNAISLVKNQQLISMGCGQTSRVDALKQAIQKAQNFGFDIEGAVIASEAFFPFSDCVQIAAEHKIAAIAQPGGSKKDQDSIDEANKLGVAMVLTGVRHFLH